MYGEGRSNFSNHLIKEGLEMKDIDNIKTIVHKENDHEKISKLEDEIVKEVASLNIMMS